MMRDNAMERAERLATMYTPLVMDSRMVSIIKAEMEEEFKRTYGKPYDWKNILKSNSVKKVAEDLKLTLTISYDLGRFRTAIMEMLRNSEKYQFVPDDRDPERMWFKIRRINKYEGITDYKSLIHLVEKHPGGLFVDEELTVFTFREAKTEIERAIGEKRIKRIYKENTKDEYYYIFPREFETEFQIRQDSFKYFGMNEYLDLSSHLNSAEDEGDKVIESKEKSSKESNADPNYKLPGYLELKEKWQKKNLRK